MRTVVLVASLVVLAWPAWAEERVLHCADTKSAGFLWEEGQTEGQITKFEPMRYIVKVKVLTSEDRPLRFRAEKEERTITPTIGDAAGTPNAFYCKKPYAYVLSEFLVCNELGGMGQWVFNGNRYVRAYMFGTPIAAKHADPNISISYGTCTEF